jgi:hypothetical protein
MVGMSIVPQRALVGTFSLPSGRSAHTLTSIVRMTQIFTIPGPKHDGKKWCHTKTQNGVIKVSQIDVSQKKGENHHVQGPRQGQMVP